MKIAILGTGGMLGHAMTRYFSTEGHEVLELTRKHFDLAAEDPEPLWRHLKARGIEAVINCAGVIKPQIAKQRLEDVLKVNTVFPHNLGLYASQNDLKAFHITTDCVYTGKKGNYSENDFFDATDVYGMSKNGGEPRTLMTLRTSIIGEENGQARSLLEWARSQTGKTVKGFTNHHWNGVTTLQLAKVIHQILQNDLYQPGLFHIHSPAPVTKAELLRILNRTYNLKLQVHDEEGPEFCDRTLTSLHPLSRNLVRNTIETQAVEMNHFFRLDRKIC